MKKMFISIFILFVYLFNYNIYLENKYEDFSDYISNTTVNEVSTYYNMILSNSPVEVFNDEYYAPHYFKNLIYSFPLNTHGTCNYTSISMLLSFYDTYWADYVIDEQFENTSYVGTNPNYSTMYSPGLKYENESNFNIPSSQYFSYINETRNTYFQSYLIYLANQANISISDTNLGANYNQVYNLLDYYLNMVNFNTINKFTIISNITESMSVIEFTRLQINTGVPVILRIGKSSTNKGHTVIAYDVDQNGEIYVHTGWKRNGTALSHVPLSLLNQVLGYNVLYDAISLIKNYKHEHSYNYLSNSNFCACEFRFPHNLLLNSKYYTDTLPVFKFTATTKENWFLNNNNEIPEYKYNVTITDINNKIIQENINSNEFTVFKPSQWNEFVYMESNYIVNVEGELIIDNIAQLSQTKYTMIVEKEFEMPDVSSFSITPSNSNVTAQNYNESSSLINYQINNRIINANYYKTMYDEENDVLTLLCNPEQNGSASIEYNLSCATTRVDVRLSLRNGLDIVDSHDYEIVLYDYKSNSTNELEEIGRLYNADESNNYSYDINNLACYKIYFNEPHENVIMKINYIGENNEVSSGEVYLGNVLFYPYNENNPLPVSGYEIPYEPDIWNEGLTYDDNNNQVYIKDITNCYSYVVNNTNCRMEIGSSTGHPVQGSNIINVSNIKDKMVQDSIEYNFYWEEIGKYEICPTNTYKVALYIDNENYSSSFTPDYGYHFYRQNPDGSWSHKLGDTEVTNLDYLDNIILDPDLSDRRGTQQYENYNYLVGYFAVTKIYEGDII